MEMQSKESAQIPEEERSQALSDQIIRYFRQVVEIISAVVLAVDLVVVFVSVIYRYFLHNPLQWSDEVAQMLLVALTFLGGAAALARGEHLGVTVIRARLSARVLDITQALGGWIIGTVAITLCWSAIAILPLSMTQTTSTGLSESLFFYPVMGGAAAMFIFAIAALLKASWRAIVIAALVLIVCDGIWLLWGLLLPDSQPTPIILLVLGFVLCLISGVPIAFSLGFAALIFLWSDGTLPIAIYAQQIESGINNFVLLAVPFFVLAGLIMDVNGMSARLIGLLQLLIGKIRGGLQVVMIASMALFSGISGSKTADVAAVGSLLLPAMRKDGQDIGDSVALLASTAVMGETIPPCINIIILGSVANISIGGLFAAGILPAVTMAAALILVSIWTGSRAKKAIVEAPKSRSSIAALIAGAVLALVMMVIIFGGILGGIATPTEVSAFAVVYALVAGGLAFKQMTWRKGVKLFVDAGSLAGMVLFIVAVAQMVAYILTEQEVPQTMAAIMTSLAGSYGNWVFLLISIVLLICMGSVLEGAPALIIFGPLLIPIGEQLGIQPLHFGIIIIVAMGLGLFAPPLGVGLYTACAVGGVSIEQVSRPSLKYLAIIFVCLLVITFVPWITLILPQVFGIGH